MSIRRPQISDETVELVITAFRDKLQLCFEKHGRGSCLSMHETRGMLEEEINELQDEIRANNKEGFFRESIDVMIAAFWGAVSEKSGALSEKWD